MSEKQVTIFIDDVAYQVSSTDNLLAAVLSQKLNLPYFCWHPAMGSVGACRQCAVMQFQDSTDDNGRMVMACTTPVTEGMRVSIKHHQASEFREQIIAAMMTNHPHDCPVCAEGGECHLQDMTVMTGHSVREYQGTKRTFNNQYLGELIGHEMNRCITCYRCTRFYNDYAGGKDFGVFGSKNQVYFGRHRDGALASEFSGNLVEVCPTGVFSNKVFSAHYTRKWDLQSAPSICSHCAVGCNLSIGERYGTVRRVMNRYNAELNGYFLCDRGRFGIGFVNAEQRIRRVKGVNQQSPVALTSLDIAKAFAHFRNKSFLAIGSARASLEANFYLKQIVGAEQFCAGYNDDEMIVAAQHAQLLAKHKPPSLAAIEASDFVFIVGEDITQTAPRMALSVRQALRHAAKAKAAKLGIASWQDSAVRTSAGNELSPLFLLQSTSTKLDDVAEQSLLLPVGQFANCIRVLTALLQKSVLNRHFDLQQALNQLATQTPLTEHAQAFIGSLFEALCQAQQPLIIAGCSSCQGQTLAEIEHLLQEIKQRSAADATQLPKLPQLAVVPVSANSVGILSLLDEHTLSISQVLAKLKHQKNTFQGVIVLEQELASLSDSEIQQLRAICPTLIVLDHSSTRLSVLADILLPVAAVSEGDGHYVNYQGQVQRFYQVHAPVLPIQESWRWLDTIAGTLTVNGAEFSAQSQTNKKHGLCQSLAELHHYFRQTFTDWPQLVLDKIDAGTTKAFARMPHRASGRTAQMANISVHEAKTTQKIDDSLSFSMEGQPLERASDMPFTWAPGWNSNQSINQFQRQVNGQLLQQKAAQYITVSEQVLKNPCWQLTEPEASSRVTTCAKQDHIASADSMLVSYVQQANIYLSEWQAAQTAEFQMLRASNLLSISAALAKQFGITKGQWCKVVLSSCQGITPRISHSVISQVVIVEQLPANLMFGNFPLSPSLAPCLEVYIIAAEPQALSDYLSAYNDQLMAAKKSKQALLERLKANDQHIPIRLLSGGLDDD
ncbi:NADH dehydrogenase subunit G [Colwellia chukchiensis]|uniref:NADH-quinone oxidoreductase subunit G n=1 Tax=Colwellia chukchiensis TaxID=641665 RepID=A0A1H7H0Y4_9GAMM|nr:NADH-quinone oxidoreductase subunit NuoG [Colwellia chukchiensis]SEK44083.1 NADH dehydrogenase subunit G [Colwellia chukchiensis]